MPVCNQLVSTVLLFVFYDKQFTEYWANEFPKRFAKPYIIFDLLPTTCTYSYSVLFIYFFFYSVVLILRQVDNALSV